MRNEWKWNKHRRYLLLAEFLYRTGGRIDEVLLVKLSEINLATFWIRHIIWVSRNILTSTTLFISLQFLVFLYGFEIICRFGIKRNIK